MNKYPDYVNKFRPKGTIIKKVNDTYYVYEATSKRVEGKKYPVQVVKGVIGKIDTSGFHSTEKVKVDSIVSIKECGFTNYILLFKDSLLKDINLSQKMQDRITILHSLICYLSPNSYLLNQYNDILNIDELINKYKISLGKQILSIERIIEHKINEIEDLKYICRVYIDGRELKSTLTDSQINLIKKLGVMEDDIK